MTTSEKDCKVYENAQLQILLKVMALEKFNFKSFSAKKEWQEMLMTESKDEITCHAISFAIRWAKIMQFIMRENKSVTVSKIADKTSYFAEYQEPFEGLNGGIIYDNAIIMLCKYWVYGDELRKWHNAQLGYYGEGIVFPTTTNIWIKLSK